MDEIKVAIIGFGGIARTHYVAYEELKNQGYPIQIVAICEKNKERIFEEVKINLGTPPITVSKEIAIYDDIDEMLMHSDFDMADVCLPTFLHKEMTVKLLQAGKHVLCEKPMALTSADCNEMTDAAKKAKKRLMISQCLRFDYRYLYLKRCIDENSFGKLQYLLLERHCDYPGWAGDFKSLDRTGGCILDTHIHDIDMARFLLGDPISVSTVRNDEVPHRQLVNTRMHYDGTVVIADTAWDEAREIPFAAGFRAKFERGSIDCTGHRILVTPHNKNRFPADLAQNNPFAEEIRAMGDLILNPEKENRFNPPESSADSVKLVEYLKESAEKFGDKIYL